MKKFIILLIVSYFLSYIHAAAAEKTLNNERIAIHPKIGYLFNFHTADFYRFKGAIDCGLFKSGSGSGLTASLSVEYPLSDNLKISLGAGWFDRSGLLKVSNSFLSRDSVLMEPVEVQTDNKMDATLPFIEIMPGIRYTLTDKFISGPLRLNADLRFGFSSGATFRQSEEIVSPNNVVFIYDGKNLREREIASGDIAPIASPVTGISFGLENLLKVGKSSHFSQSIVFDYNLTNFVKDVTWKSAALRLELGLRLGIKRKEAPITEPPAEEPVKDIEKPVIAKEDKKEIEKEKKIIPPPPPPPDPVLDVEITDYKFEILTGNELTATVPLVNAVFFDRNSDKIPDEYIIKSGNDFENIDDAIDIHYYLFQRIADIVKRNPEAEITLEGATSGKDNEPAGTSLAKARAESAKDALIKCGVPGNIITIRYRIYPRILSNQDFEEGAIENQRVDIILKNAPTQEYVNIQNYAELQGDYQVKPRYANIPEGRKPSLKGFRNFIKEVEHDSPVKIPVLKRLANDEEVLNLKAVLNFETKTAEADKDIDISDIESRQVELNLDNFEAILRFDYNSSELSSENKELLRQLTEKLPEGSSIIIYGSADALGTEQRNVQLETERAGKTRKFIESVAPGKFTITASRGSEKYNEATPQGRFLNRSIRLRVKD